MFPSAPCSPLLLVLCIPARHLGGDAWRRDGWHSSSRFLPTDCFTTRVFSSIRFYLRRKPCYSQAPVATVTVVILNAWERVEAGARGPAAAAWCRVTEVPLLRGGGARLDLSSRPTRRGSPDCCHDGGWQRGAPELPPCWEWKPLDVSRPFHLVFFIVKLLIAPGSPSRPSCLFLPIKKHQLN